MIHQIYIIFFFIPLELDDRIFIGHSCSKSKDKRRRVFINSCHFWQEVLRMTKKSWRKGKGRSSTKAQLIVRVFRTSSSPNEITSWNTSSFHRNECFWEKKILKRAKNFKKNLRPQSSGLSLSAAVSRDWWASSS